MSVADVRGDEGSGVVVETIELRPGWNLIGITLPPKSPNVDDVLRAALEKKSLLSVWGYDQTSGWAKTEFAGRAAPGAPPTLKDLPPYPDEPKKLESLVAGRGYWIELGPDAGASLTCTYEALVVPFEIRLASGWNLIGTDADINSAAEVKNTSLAAAFGTTLPKVVFGYDASRGMVPEQPWLIRSRGYWVKLDQARVLKPSYQTFLDSDIDVDPKAKVKSDWPGPGDLDFNANGRFDGPQEQTVVSLGFSGRVAEFVLRAEGEGLLSFLVETVDGWRSRRAVNEPYGMIMDSDGAHPREEDWKSLHQANWLRDVSPTRGVLPRSALDVSGEDVREATVRVTIDRSGLTPGHYLSRLRISTTGGTKALFVHFSVPPFSGNFEGVATIRRVNGKPIEVGAIDVRICLEQRSDGTIVGYIDKDGTPVVPTDVPLVGHVLGTPPRILLAGAYSLPARDKNSTEGSNPFTSRLVRYIAINGYEGSPGQFRGEFRDVFWGALPFPVTAMGIEKDGGGVSLLRVTPKNTRDRFSSFPLPDKPPPQAILLSGVVNGIANNSPGRVSLVGMSRAVAVDVNTAGEWNIPGVYPGIYRLSHNSHVARLIQVETGGAVTRLDGESGAEPATELTAAPLNELPRPNVPSGTPSVLTHSQELGNSKTGNPTMKLAVAVHYGLELQNAAQPGVRFQRPTSHRLDNQ